MKESKWKRVGKELQKYGGVVLVVLVVDIASRLSGHVPTLFELYIVVLLVFLHVDTVVLRVTASPKKERRGFVEPEIKPFTLYDLARGRVGGGPK